MSAPRLRFAAIGLNHGHINGQVDTVTRGGGELAAFFRQGDRPRRRVREAVDDVLNRTRTADDQARAFLAMELGLRAERDARRITF